MARSVQGIDVSESNGNIVWSKVRSADKRFAFLKVNEGDRIDTKTTSGRVQAAKKAGLLVGGYDFLRPRAGRTGAQEFDIFYRHAKEVGLVNKGCLRPVADVEATGFSGSEEALRTRRYVYSWINRCIKVTAHHPIIYTASWFWDGVMHARNPHGCKLWLADYTAQWEHHIPAGFGHASFHQYTDKGTVAGIAGHVDLDKYLSSLADLKRTHTL